MKGWCAAVAAAGAAGWLALCAAAFVVAEAKGGTLACAGNATVHEFAASGNGEWAVVVLGEVAGGFPYLREVVARARRWSPAAFVLVGDAAIKGDARHLALATRELERCVADARVFAVPGSRESRSNLEGAQAFLDAFGARTFDFRIGGTRFLGVDNTTGTPEADALAMLEEKLAEADAVGDEVIVCAYRDPALTGHDGGHTLAAILREYRVEYVFTGEGGKSSLETRDGTTFVGAPPSGQRTVETDQTPISFLVLRHAEGKTHVALERFYRKNVTELEGAFLHLALAHVRPLARARPVPFVVVLAGCATYLVVWLARMRRGLTPKPAGPSLRTGGSHSEGRSSGG
ncbi:MAG: hypothetical protein V2A58_02760 [Planctomycetota bacterium]